MAEPAFMILFQDEIWIDNSRVTHLIKDMDAEYCGNVLRWLRRRAEALHWTVSLHANNQVALTNGYDDERHWVNATHGYIFTTFDADEWLNSTPLVIALRRRIDSILDWIGPPEPAAADGVVTSLFRPASN